MKATGLVGLGRSLPEMTRDPRTMGWARGAGAAALLAGLAFWATEQLMSWHWPVFAAVALGVATTAPALAALRRPLGAWFVIASGLAVTTAVGPVPGAGSWPWPMSSWVVMLAVLGVAGARATRVRAVVAAVSTALVVVAPAALTVGLPAAWVALAWAHVAAAVIVGRAVRARGAARLMAHEEAERRVAWQERARIAREMHDVLAHRLSLIALQAEAASVEFPHAESALQSRLEFLRSTAAQGLREMRTVLGVLRDEDGGDAPRDPVPGLGEVVALLEEQRRAGIEVRADIPTLRPPAGDPAGELSIEAEAAVYRTLQEALSNAARHGAAGAAVDVELSWEANRLLVRVENPTDSALGDPAASGGWGLRGMRERVEAVGGALRTGSSRGGSRFAVAADFPRHHSTGDRS
jgi:signal transduction histidine kinase